MSTTVEHTADDLFANPPDGPWELVRGELHHMSPAGSKHGWVILNIAGPLREFVLANQLGFVFGAETGFVIETDPDTVRAPDVAFVRKDRVEGELPDQFFPGAPDIAVEVLSPSDSASSVQEKSEDWLNAGCHEVWLVDPRRKTASKCTLGETGMLTQSVNELSTELMPGFELTVAAIFE
ncbi:MAG: Uma2 family endonuclease [Planctomycetaceae bacterium]